MGARPGICHCQHPHPCPRPRWPVLLLVLQAFAFVSICAQHAENFNGPIAYRRHLSDLRIQELHNLAKRMEQSINPDKYACESFYDYVCSRNKPLFSVLGHMPKMSELIVLLGELQNDGVQFEAKQKMTDFFISCNTLRSLEDCYRETFVYFRPLFGYVINKYHVDGSTREYGNFMEVLNSFLIKAERTENFRRNPIRLKLLTLRENFRNPSAYFRIGSLNDEYQTLRIFRESYEHNLRNLERFRKKNSTYEMGVERTILDWSLYVYQSRQKPMSYFFPTLNVHLWMALYNSTARLEDVKWYTNVGNCLKLPQFVNALEEARIMAVVYLKSFRNAWQDYRDWITQSAVNQETFDQENTVLMKHHLDNKRIFFTLYAQNFCGFGKELAENVFYLGLRNNQDFYGIYSCGFQTERGADCV